MGNKISLNLALIDKPLTIAPIDIIPKSPIIRMSIIIGQLLGIEIFINTTKGGIIIISAINKSIVPLTTLEMKIVHLSIGAAKLKVNASNSFSKTNIRCNPNELTNKIIIHNNPGEKV